MASGGYGWSRDGVVCVTEIQALVTCCTFQRLDPFTDNMDLQSRIRVLSRVVGKSYECITPRSILKDITTEREKQFGANSTQQNDEANAFFTDSLKNVPGFSRRELVKQRHSGPYWALLEKLTTQVNGWVIA